MLELDSEKRITAEQALAHPYLAQYADPTDEPDSLPYDQSFEDMELPVDKWKGDTNYPFTSLFGYKKVMKIYLSKCCNSPELVYHEVVNFIPQQHIPPGGVSQLPNT